MLVLITEKPGQNSYVTELIDAYQKHGHTVVCDVHNFFYSNLKPDVVHIHWPERLDQWYSIKDSGCHFERIKARLNYFKKVGSVIVHTVHNLYPHSEYKNVVKADKTYELVVSASDILVHHCKLSVKWLAELYPSAKNKIQVVSRHGPYVGDFKKITQLQAKTKLGLSHNSFLILSFGVQRPNKGTDFVHEMFSALSIPGKALLVAGKFEYPDGLLVRTLYKIRNYVRDRFAVRGRYYISKSVEADMLPYVFSAADIVFLGHKYALNSGVLIMAATYNKVAVYPSIGCFGEAIEGCYSEYYTASDKFSAKNAVERAYGNIILGEDANNAGWLEKVSWSTHVSRITDAIGGMGLDVGSAQ